MAKRKCYIESMIAKNGENWVALVPPDSIQKSTKRIVKELAKGMISFDQYGKYFLDNKFMENLLIGIHYELEINTLNYSGCYYYYQAFPQIPNMGSHILHLERVIYIYNVILDRLQLVKSTGNVGYMVDINGLLFNDRKHVDLI